MGSGIVGANPPCYEAGNKKVLAPHQQGVLFLVPGEG